MTDLSEDELGAMRRARREYWERSAYNTPNAFEREKYEITFRSGWVAAREYSKQRDEKLREALKQIAGDAEVRINGVTLTGTLDGMAARAVARAALAENGDSDAD